MKQLSHSFQKVIEIVAHLALSTIWIDRFQFKVAAAAAARVCSMDLLASQQSGQDRRRHRRPKNLLPRLPFFPSKTFNNLKFGTQTYCCKKLGSNHPETVSLLLLND